MARPPLRSFRRVCSLLSSSSSPSPGGKTIWCAISGRPHGWRRRFLFFLTASGKRADVLVPKEMCGALVSRRFPSLRAIHREALLRDGNRPVSGFLPPQGRHACTMSVEHNTPPPRTKVGSRTCVLAASGSSSLALQELSRENPSSALCERGVRVGLCHETPSSSSRAKLVPSGWRLLCVPGGNICSFAPRLRTTSRVCCREIHTCCLYTCVRGVE